jgi:indolepyruvate ferredoxin oxidoreductase
MRIKDEYEVARLLTAPEFRLRLTTEWEAVRSYSFLLHPPLLRRFGLKTKIRIGPKSRWLLTLLARLKRLRGTPFDLFGYTRHRRLERSLVDWYCQLVEQALLCPDSQIARQLCALPEMIRGYEHIKERSIERARAAATELLARARQLPLLHA